MEKKTGHRDEVWNRIDETSQARLRNQLQPFWTLIDILHWEHINKLLSTSEWKDILQQCVVQCKMSQSNILNLLQETEK